MFTKAKVGDQTILVLAPLSVQPEYQKQGVGSALMQEGHRIAKRLGYHYINVLGSAQYYPRFGYHPAAQLGLATPDGLPPENFMILKLYEDAKPLKGTLEYAKEFGI